MLGTTHAALGWSAGLALAPMIGAHTLPQAVVLAAITTGATLLPHLDHPDARQSRLIYLLTAALSALTQGVSRVLYRLTRGRHDEYSGSERHYVTHTLLFAGLIGAGVSWWVSVARAWAVIAVLLLSAVFVVDALGDWLLPVVAGAALVALVNRDEVAGISPWLGVAVGIGCLLHYLGEACTGEGSPLLWPLPLSGQTWRELHAPALVCFPTGGLFELGLLLPACVIAGVLLLPGVPALLAALFA